MMNIFAWCSFRVCMIKLKITFIIAIAIYAVTQKYVDMYVMPQQESN